MATTMIVSLFSWTGFWNFVRANDNAETDTILSAPKTMVGWLADAEHHRWDYYYDLEMKTVRIEDRILNENPFEYGGYYPYAFEWADAIDGLIWNNCLENNILLQITFLASEDGFYDDLLFACHPLIKSGDLKNISINGVGDIKYTTDNGQASSVEDYYRNENYTFYAENNRLMKYIYSVNDMDGDANYYTSAEYEYDNLGRLKAIRKLTGDASTKLSVAYEGDRIIIDDSSMLRKWDATIENNTISILQFETVYDDLSPSYSGVQKTSLEVKYNQGRLVRISPTTENCGPYSVNDYIEYSDDMVSGFKGENSAGYEYTAYQTIVSDNSVSNHDDVIDNPIEYRDDSEVDAFDIDVFLANLAFDAGTNPKTNGASPYKNAVTNHHVNNQTSRFVKELEKDKSLNFWFAASDVMDNTFNFDPAYGQKLDATFRDYFTAVLYSIIDISANSSEVLDALDSKTNKNLVKFSKSMFKTLDSADKLNLNAELSNNSLSKENAEIVKSNVSQAIEDSTDISDTLGETLDIIQLLISTAKTIDELEENVAIFTALYNTASETFAVLKEMRANCGDAEMIKVLDKMIACQTDATSAYVEMAKANLGLAVTDIYDVAWPELRSAILGALGPEVKALYGLFGAVEKGTSAFCNVVLGTDKVKEQYNKLMVIVMAEDLLYSANQSLAKKYLSNMTKKNAKNYNQSVDMYFSLYSLECEYVDTFAKKVYLEKLFSNSDKYKNWSNSINGIKETAEKYHDLMMSDWLLDLLEINYPGLFSNTVSTKGYGKIINETRKSIENGEWKEKAILGQTNVSFTADEVGFLVKDLDVDGIPELIVAPYKINGELNTSNFVFTIYSMNNGQPVKLFDSYYNWNYYVYDGDHIVEVGKDNGASDRHVNVYRIQNSRLYLTEGVRLSHYSDQGGSDNYYHSIGFDKPIASAIVSGYGAEDSTYSYDEFIPEILSEEEISRSDYEAYLDKFQNKKTRTFGIVDELQHIDADLQVDRLNIDVQKNQFFIIRVYNLPSGEYRTDLNWETTNPSVATVDQYGIVTAVNSGKCELIVRTKDKTKAARITVTVYDLFETSPTQKGEGIQQDAQGRWAYFKGGTVDTNYTGIAQNQYGWWRIKDGFVDFKATGIFKNEFGWWRVEKGKVNFNANGIYQNQYGWWKTTNGKVTFKETGVFQNEFGWWRVKDSKVDFSANGIYPNKHGWWKTTNGKITFKENGVFQNEFGWWKVKDSKVDFAFTGIASNKYGSWYIKNGRVDFSKNGKVNYNRKTYTVKGGKVQ